jgi:hypothetical protein
MTPLRLDLTDYQELRRVADEEEVPTRV